MKNRKPIRISILFGVIAIALMASVLLTWAMHSNRTFASSAVISYVSEEKTYAQASISAGSTYRFVYPDAVIVKDSTAGETLTLSRDSFVKTSAGEIFAFNDGVLMDTSRFSAGITTSYNIEYGTSMYETSSGYSVYNNDIEIPLTSFLWKLSGETYLLGGDDITLHLPDGTSYATSGVVQISWLEDGIVETIADELCWVTITTSYSISFGNASLDVEAAIVSDSAGANSFTLATLSAENASDERVTLSGNSAHPSWIFTIINGLNGADGTDGTNGSTGINGIAGENGTDGTNGATGADGADGRDGEGNEEEEDVIQDATVALNKYEVTADSITGTITVTEGTWTLSDFTLQILDENGSTVATVTESGGTVGEGETGFSAFALSESTDTETDVRTITITFAASGLDTNTQYTLLLYASYYENGTFMGTKACLSRSFYTDANGVQIRTYQVTTTGATFTVSRGNTEVDVTLVLQETAGEEEEDTPLATYSNLFDGSEELSTQLTLDVTLSPNTTYYIVVYTEETAGEVYSFTTLKRTISFGDLTVSNGIGSSTLLLENLYDPDHAITQIRYLIYLSTDENETIVSQVNANTSTGEGIVVFDGENLLFTTGNISNQKTVVYDYLVKAQIVTYDNEKEVVYETELGEDEYLRCVAVPDTSFYLCTEDTVGSTYAASLYSTYLQSGTMGSFWLQYSVTGQYQVNFGTIDLSDLYIVVYSADPNYSSPKIYTYTATDLDTYTTTGIQIGEVTANEYYKIYAFWLDLNLKSNYQYYVYVYGEYTDIARMEAGMDNYSGFAMLGYCTFTAP